MLVRVNSSKKKATHYVARSSSREYAMFKEDCSSLGNPFNKEESRDISLLKYKEYLEESYELEDDIFDDIQKIIDFEAEHGVAILGCFCSNNEKCHADVIIDFIKSKKGEKNG